MAQRLIKAEDYERILAHLVAVEETRSQWTHDQFPLLSPQRENMVQLLDNYVNQLEALMKNALRSSRAGDELPFVIMGSQVEVLNPPSGKRQTFVIVPFYEQRVNNNHISILSPLGSALLLKAKGDLVTINAPRGDIDWEVISIKYPDISSPGD